MLAHLAATLDNWDPRLVNELAKSRHLILLDLPGVGGSGGTVRSPRLWRRRTSRRLALSEAWALAQAQAGTQIPGFKPVL